MSNPPSSTSQRPQKPKTAAQRASEANTLQQHAVRTNTARPNDRQMGDPQGTEPGHRAPAPAAHTKR
jgi:hypothetical protein